MKLPAILVKFSSYRLCILQKFVWVRFPPPQKKTRQPPSPKETHDFRWMIRELYRKKNLPKKKKKSKEVKAKAHRRTPQAAVKSSRKSAKLPDDFGFRISGLPCHPFLGGMLDHKNQAPPPPNPKLVGGWTTHLIFFFLNLDHLPRARGENRQHFKPRPRIVKVNPLSQGKERPGPCEPAKKKTSYFPFNPGSLIGILYYFMVSYGPHLIV